VWLPNVLKNLDVDLRKIRLEVEKNRPSGPEMVNVANSANPRAEESHRILVECSQTSITATSYRATSCSACYVKQEASPLKSHEPRLKLEGTSAKRFSTSQARTRGCRSGGTGRDDGEGNDGGGSFEGSSRAAKSKTPRSDSFGTRSSPNSPEKANSIRFIGRERESNERSKSSATDKKQPVCSVEAGVGKTAIIRRVRPGSSTAKCQRSSARNESSCFDPGDDVRRHEISRAN